MGEREREEKRERGGSMRDKNRKKNKIKNRSDHLLTLSAYISQVASNTETARKVQMSSVLFAYFDLKPTTITTYRS